MATSDFAKIASYPNAAEAEHVLAVLENNGVPAFVEGTAANTTLSSSPFIPCISCCAPP